MHAINVFYPQRRLKILVENSFGDLLGSDFSG